MAIMATGWDCDYRYEPNPLFEQTFICLPFSKYKSPRLQSGDKIVMPPSSLDLLDKVLPYKYPLTFKIETFVSDRVSHCGVLDEFDAEEGYVYMPGWMMDNLKITEGDKVVLSDANLPKAWLIKLQPHTTSIYTKVPDPKALLECRLSAFTCLSHGDTIMVRYGGNEFYIDVVFLGPDAVCLFDMADCDVELATPLDYVDEKEGSRDE